MALDGANINTTRANFLLKMDYFFSHKIRKPDNFLRPEGCRFIAGHINDNGLFPTHFSLFGANVDECRFDDIASSETKLFCHVDREGMSGGGVAMRWPLCT